MDSARFPLKNWKMAASRRSLKLSGREPESAGIDSICGICRMKIDENLRNCNITSYCSKPIHKNCLRDALRATENEDREDDDRVDDVARIFDVLSGRLRQRALDKLNELMGPENIAAISRVSRAIFSASFIQRRWYIFVIFFSIRTNRHSFLSSSNHEMALFFFSSRSNNIIFFLLNEGKWHHPRWWRQTSFGIPFNKHLRLIAWFYQLRNPSRCSPLSWIKSVIKNDCTIECRRCGKLYEISHSAGSHILFRPEHMCTVFFPGTADQLSIRLLIFSYQRKMIF